MTALGIIVTQDDADQALTTIARAVALAPAPNRRAVLFEQASGLVTQLGRDFLVKRVKAIAESHDLLDENFEEDVAVLFVRNANGDDTPSNFPSTANGHAAEDVPPPNSLQDYDLPADGTAEPAELTITIPPTKRFTPIAIDDVTVAAEPAWLIHRLLPARGLATVVGPPKSGKSFLTTDALFAVARGEPWAGRDVLTGPVVYLTGEGVSGFKRRLIAMRRHYAVEGQGVPFYMVENVPDLGSEKTDVDVLLRDLSQDVAKPRAIVLDTLARCMGEGDENATRDMGRFVTRCALIERHFGCVVVVVHHMGKDPSRGSRGSNSLNGAVDVTWQVEKGEARNEVTITEMKDAAEGQAWTFRLSPVDLGETFSDDRNITETSTCVIEILSEPKQAKQGETKTARPPRGVNGDLLKVIKRAIADAGEINVGSVEVPANVRAVSREMLKKYCTTMGWQDPDAKPDAFRSDLSRGLKTLRQADHIGMDQHWVWVP